MKKMSRRLFALCAAACALPAFADTYPSRPVKILVGFAPGGSTDAVARYYAQKLGEVMKASVIVDNKPGAGQMVAIRSVMAAQPDGYTLYLGTGSAFSQGPGVRKDLGYDPLKDFSLVGLMATAPGVIVVTPKLPIRTLGELAKLSTAPDSKLNYGSSGIGSASHLQTEYLLQLTGSKMVHIPYKADADIMRELTVGSIHLGMAPLQGAMASIATGKVRALAVTGAHRVKALPDVPSVRETGIKGIESIDPYSYYGLVGPVGLPPSVVATLNEAINRVAALPETKSILEDRLNFEAESGSPEAFRKYIQADLKKWTAFGKTVKLAE